jgi:uncharacterized protein
MASHLLIAGGTGLIGQALAAEALNRGWMVTLLSRHSRSSLPPGVPKACQLLNWHQLADCSITFDAIVNLAGESIAQGRWTAARKALLLASRVQTTEQLVRFCQNAPHRPQVFINASAIGFYGDQADAPLDENSPGKDCFSHRLCHAWEQTLAPLKTLTGVRVCVARLGVVMSLRGGALSAMRQPCRFKVAVQQGDGSQWFSWIGEEDAVAALIWLIEQPGALGVYNLTAPNPLTQANLTDLLAQAFHAPFKLQAPAALLRLALGDMASELLLSSQRVLPKRLEASGFTFANAELGSWLAHKTQAP